MDQSVFHPGELAAQALAGVATPQAAIRGWMPDQQRAFLGQLPFLPIATTDMEGLPVATILTGVPGFISSPSRSTLLIAARPDPGDPAGSFFVPEAPVGILGIDLTTRRRNRVNGTLQSIGLEGITVAVAQSFGNCPQYIQTRLWHHGAAAAVPTETFDGLDPAARTTIATADTFFVASSTGGAVDISHRGGRPGFVAVANDTLTIPDFRGNHYFNTLGNLLVHPGAALLFVDWTSGTLLHLSGRVEILWDENQAFPGAERLWRVSVSGGWRRVGALPLRWVFGAFAPQTLRTGTWELAVERPVESKLLANQQGQHGGG